MTVSVALIVKNEARTLGRCLESLRDAVDEVVVVDTGSEDATMAVAQRYTDRIWQYPWRDDFAAARQYAFDQAVGDWVMWVDADDVVHGAEHIRSLTAHAAPEVGALHWRYVLDRDAWGNIHGEFWRERCVRHDGSFRWSGRIHEVLVAHRPWAVEYCPEVVVEHRREGHRSPEKLRRNLSLLEAEYAEQPATPSPRLLFYLGREYASAGETDKALGMYLRYLDIATWDDERYMAQTRIAMLHRLEKRYERAIEADLKALKICPHWPDAYFGLAETYYFLQDWHKVIHWSDIGRAMPRPETLQILNPMAYRYAWIIYYTNALYHVGAIEEALTWTKRALEICPDDPMHQQNFLLFGSEIQTRQSASGTARDKMGVTYG